MEAQLRFFAIEGGPEAPPSPGPPEPFADAGGYVKLYRKALDSPELKGKAGGLGLWPTLLLLARWKAGSCKGESLQAGQLVTTIPELCRQTGLSREQVRKRLAAYQKSAMIRTFQRTNRFHVVTICNWTSYQSETTDDEPTEEPSKNRPRTDREPTDSLKAPISRHYSVPKKERRKEGKNREEKKRSAPLDPKVKEVCSALWDSWKAKHDIEPNNYPVLQAVVKRLMKTMTAETIIRAWGRYLEDRTNFFADHGWGKFPNWIVANCTTTLEPEPTALFGQTR